MEDRQVKHISSCPKRAATRVDFIKRTGRYGPFILEFSEVSQFYYLCGINFAARRPNIGLPICVSDSLMDFFFRKTFSPVADTTLNSIFPEKVAVNDLKETARVRKKTTYLLVIISRGSVTPVQILTNSTYHSLVSPNKHLNGLMYTH